MRYARPDGKQRCEARGCSNLFELKPHAPRRGRSRKRFCSITCRYREYQHRSGRNKPLQVGVCRNGHVRTPENTELTLSPAGTGKMVKRCKECHLDRQREYYQVNGEVKRAKNRDYHAQHREKNNAKRKRNRLKALRRERLAAIESGSGS